VSKKPQSPMNRAKPTKKATPTSKREGDKPIVEAVGSAGEWQLRRAEERNLPAVFVLDTSCGFLLHFRPGYLKSRPTTNQNVGAAVRKLVITQNMTVDGSIEMLGDWFTSQGQADQGDLIEEIHRQGEQVTHSSPADRPL
jgi:hypothetical protein